MTIEPSKEVAAVAKPAPPAPKYFQLIPKDISEAMKFAEMIAASDFAPKGYAGKAGNCLVAMQYGAELGLPPLQALQNIAVINNKPGIYGDLGKALLLSKGFRIEERDIKEVQAKNEAHCKVTRPDGQIVERTFSMENAKTAKLAGKEGPWTNYPYRMMAWRAFWWAARDAAADVLKGISGIEELQDYKTDAIDASVVEANAPKEISPADKGTAVHEAVKAADKEPTPANPVVDATPTAPKPPENAITPEQRKHIVGLMAKNKVSPEALRKYLFDVFGISEKSRPTTFIRQQDYAQVCKWIEAPQEEIPFGV